MPTDILSLSWKVQVALARMPATAECGDGGRFASIFHVDKK